MSYKVDFAAADLNVQVELLKHFPEIANARFYPAMNRAAREVKSAIGSRMTFQDRSGNARRELTSKVSGRGLNISARVGWFGNVSAYYVNVLEHGADPHVIGFVPRLGVQFGKNNPHPGVPPLKFVEGGFNDAKGMVEAEMEMASALVVADLEVK